MINKIDGIEEQRVLDLEDEYVAAEINRDEIALRRIIDDRFVLNSNDGRTSNKSELIEKILSWNMSGQTITERSVLVAGDTAVSFGTAEINFGSTGTARTPSHFRYSSVYIKRAGEWRYLALHMAKRN
jgi:ketosteroid isomerase-like protein